MSAVVIGAMPADGRVYPHTALVLTWFQLKKRQRFAVHGSLPGNASAARGSEAIAPRLQEDFPGDPAETDGSAKGRTVPIRTTYERKGALLKSDPPLTFHGLRHTLKSDPPLTFHGLRHTFAAEKYKELMDKGMGALDAHFTVSRLLGHERADVTNIYLASLSTKNMKDKH